MTLTSYAQNFEDVLLSRVLAGVEHGFYVDVGAGDPLVNSVTKAFYDRGWAGINIEPLGSMAARLDEDRPRDVNLQIAVADSNGEMPFYEVEDNSELSSIIPVIADQYAESGRHVAESVIEVRTLSGVLDEFLPADQEIHFLKIDVEGAEEKVLKGADFTRYRPWIVVVEVVTYGREAATRPPWLAKLEAADYERVYFDGLNEFFLARERHDELADFFLVPVNIRDDFVVATRERARATLSTIAEILGVESFSGEQEVVERTEALLRDRIEFEKRALAAEHAVISVKVEANASRQWLFERDRMIAFQAAQLSQGRMRLAQAERQLAETRDEYEDARTHLEGIWGGLSWKITRPLRVLRRPRVYLSRGNR